MGIVLDAGFCEQTCKRRERCAYYLEDLFVRFSREELAEDPLLNEPGRECPYFVERERPAAAKEEKADFFDFMKE